jgi:hypothetical protein
LEAIFARRRQNQKASFYEQSRKLAEKDEKKGNDSNKIIPLFGFAQKLSKSWKNAQNPHFSSGVKMGVSAPLLRAGFRKNRIFVQSSPF